MDLQYSHSVWDLALSSQTDQRQHHVDAVEATPAVCFVPRGWAKLCAQAQCCTLHS